MRGKVYFENKYRHVKRITPAYAGKSEKGLSKGQRDQDHPRLCGEKFTHLRAFFHFVGSPPPMRGKEDE